MSASDRAGVENGPVARISRDLAPIVPRFLEIQADHLDVMRRALAAADFQALSRCGHTIKGSAATYEFSELAEVGARIEAAAKARDAAAVEACLDALTDYLGQVTITFI